MGAFWSALLGAVGLGGTLAAVWALLRPGTGSAATRPGKGAPRTDDQYALARMLASEDNRNDGARLVIAWITVQKARNAKKTLYSLLTQGDGYGPQERGSKYYYAATTREPQKKDLDLAAKVLSGELAPSAIIRDAGPGGWVERGQLSAQTGEPMTRAEEDARLLEKQGDWNEGVYARLDGTAWILFSRRRGWVEEERVKRVKAAKDARPRNAAELKDARSSLATVATQALDSLPVISA